MTPSLVRGSYRLARAGLCLAFVYSGISKLADFQSAVAEQQHFGMPLPVLLAALTIAVQLSGSALIMAAHARAAAAGAGMLALFTLAASAVGHPFWREAGADRFNDLNSFLEHFGLVGGFVLIALIELHGFGTAPTRTETCSHPSGLRAKGDCP